MEVIREVDYQPIIGIDDALPQVRRRIRTIEQEALLSFNTSDATIRVQQGEISSFAHITTINFTPVIAVYDEGKIRVYPIELLSDSDRKRFDKYQEVVANRKSLSEFAYLPNPIALRRLRSDIL